MTTSPTIYSLFPRLAGAMPSWVEHARRARELGFNWLHLNPIQYPGFSGSLYAVKDFYRLNPLFIPDGCDDPMEELRATIAAIHDEGLSVMLDLVVNHTARDAPLIKEHPEWFRRDQEGYVVSPSAIDPADSRKVTVWGDLAEVDNANSSARQELWAYWTAMVQFYVDIGFDGFRCDAAYKVPARLWDLLIAAGRRRKPKALFVAETLGCRLAEVRGLAAAGFDFLFNSSKWWNFDQAWCMEQHEEFSSIAPSISFPESHDTRRMMEASGGLVQVQRQRYAFAAAFSAGLLMPVGYELCFRKRLDVVTTRPEDWERADDDISAFVGAVNQLAKQVPAFGAEGHWSVVTDLTSPTIVLCKRVEGAAPLLLLVNKDWTHDQRLKLPDLGPFFRGQPELVRTGGDVLRGERPPPDGKLDLSPAEVVYILQDS